MAWPPFSNVEAWLSNPTNIAPSAQVVWPIVGQEMMWCEVSEEYKYMWFFLLGEHP